jgi:hypothetical protein
MLGRHQAVLGFLLATALWAVFFVLQSEPSAHYQICETNQYTGKESCTSHHLLYVALWYIEYVINPATITAYATMAIAWFTLTLKKATDSLRAGGDQQLAHLENTAERQLRAYVFAGSAIISHLEDDGGVPEAQVFIKNVGQTPAYKVASVAGFAASIYPAPPDLNLIITDAELGQAHTRTDMGPGQTEIAIASPRPRLNRPLTEQERDELARGEAVIHVYGRISYRDIFGREQHTSYRFMVGGSVGVRGGRMVGCAEGNEAS